MNATESWGTCPQLYIIPRHRLSTKGDRNGEEIHLKCIKASRSENFYISPVKTRDESRHQGESWKWTVMTSKVHITSFLLRVCVLLSALLFLRSRQVLHLQTSQEKGSFRASGENASLDGMCMYKHTHSLFFLGIYHDKLDCAVLKKICAGQQTIFSAHFLISISIKVLFNVLVLMLFWSKCSFNQCV